MDKVFDVGNNGFVSDAVVRLLGVPPHQRQQRVLVLAASRSKAAALLATVGIRINHRDPGLFIAGGPAVDRLLAVGFFADHPIGVVNMTRAESPVIALGFDQPPRVTGHLAYDDHRVLHYTAV